MSKYCNQTFELEIIDVVHGGFGLARLDGWIVFIESDDGCIPGERVLVRVLRRQKSHYWAVVEKRLNESPLRIQPKCPHFGECGGCQFQQLDHVQQSKLKEKWLQNDVQRGLGIPKVRMQSPEIAWNWRKRIFLHARCSSTHWEIGYFKKDNSSLFMPRICPIFSEKKELFETVQKYFQTLPIRPQKNIEICVGHIPNGFGIQLHVQGDLKKDFENALNHFSSQFLSVAVFGRDKTLTSGPQIFSENILGLTIFYTLSAFIQNHPEAYTLLFSPILNRIQLSNPSIIWDLYSGVGVLTTLLRNRGYCVESVEYNRAAVHCAQKSLEENKLNADTKVLCGKVEDTLSKLSQSADCWIVNPPRDGISRQVVDSVLKMKPKELFYISCNLPTMIRDIKPLIEAGEYKAVWVEGFNLFPQTTHFEVVCQLVRN